MTRKESERVAVQLQSRSHLRVGSSFLVTLEIKLPNTVIRSQAIGVVVKLGVLAGSMT